ncbi:hypothetical protein J5N97_028146 [Dioscorea zingiberensis]|uniref:Uncharacterized protein n=1 Tax=Dioscorea zingiberensis TaxID=325984 RepID=A0A9D5BYK1_9LILI|nr:hypothetical protein J5N97_028146 [Dioscorea zingiberensis]
MQTPPEARGSPPTHASTRGFELRLARSTGELGLLLPGQQVGKTVAIVVGGAAGLCFVVICMLFAPSLRKGKDIALYGSDVANSLKLESHSLVPLLMLSNY